MSGLSRAAAHERLRMPLLELLREADAARRAHHADTLELCTIANARSGRCGEDCSFCAQSARYRTETPVFPLKSGDGLLAEAAAAKAAGAARFGIVTSGKRLSPEELETVIAAVSAISREVGIPVCASLGILDRESLDRLRAAGLVRYHHNLETAERFFPQVVTTHSYADRCRTVAAARDAGLEVCSGGIIGLGETWDDRVDLAFALRELAVDSVPLNILVPIPGTALQDQPPLSPEAALRTIALFRLVMPGMLIKVAAGRESALKDWQAMAFMAGANGMLIGGYLTIRGRSVAEDKQLVEEVRTAWQTSNGS